MTTISIFVRDVRDMTFVREHNVHGFLVNVREHNVRDVRVICLRTFCSRTQCSRVSGQCSRTFLFANNRLFAGFREWRTHFRFVHDVREQFFSTLWAYIIHYYPFYNQISFNKKC